MSGSGIFHSMKLRVAEIRKRRGWTQERLAEEANMTLHVLRKYEQDKGGMSSLDKIDKLAKALDVDPLVLVSEDAERLLNVHDRGYDEPTMVEALTMALETVEQKRLRMKPEQIARMALLFYETRMAGDKRASGE
jgi:transcriptional regulator with XRE-family HTH domain